MRRSWGSGVGNTSWWKCSSAVAKYDVFVKSVRRIDKMSKENDLTIEVYNKFGDRYLKRNEEALVENPKALADDERQRMILREYVEGLSKDAKIFEVGSAGGRDARFFLKLGYKNIIVSDIADYFLNELRKEGFEPVKFNLITDEFKDKYDFIFCWAVLVHFTKTEAKEAIFKMYDALNDGGRLAFCVKHKEGVEEEWGDYKGMIGAKRFFSYWTVEEVKSFMERLNLRNMKIAKHGGARACWIECYGEK